MNAKVYLNFQISDEELVELNNNDNNIEYLKLNVDNFLPDVAIEVFIMIAESVALNAVYDILKCSLSHVLKHFKDKKSQPLDLKVSIHKNNFTINSNTELSDQQFECLLDKIMDYYHEK